MDICTDYALPSLLPLIHIGLSHSMEEVDEMNRELAHFHMEADTDSFAVISEDKLSGNRTWVVRRLGTPNDYTYHLLDCLGGSRSELLISPTSIIANWTMTQTHKKKEIIISTSHEISRNPEDDSTIITESYAMYSPISPLYPRSWVIYSWKKFQSRIQRSIRLTDLRAPLQILESNHEGIVEAIQDLARVIPDAKKYEATKDYPKVESDIKALVLEYLPPKLHTKIDEANPPHKVLGEQFHIRHVFLNGEPRTSESTLKFCTWTEILYRPKLVLSYLRHHLDINLNMKVPKAVKNDTRGKIVIKKLPAWNRMEAEVEDTASYLRSFVTVFDMYRPKLNELFDTFKLEDGFISVK